MDFPIEGLDLAPYCCDTQKASATATASSSATVSDSPSSSSASENKDRTLYDLFAVCNHFGRMGFGHYTAFARDWMDMYTPSSSSSSSSSPSSSSSSSSSSTSGGAGTGGWYKYDDEDVTPVRDPECEIKTPAAYILFYRRRPANPANPAS